MVLTVRFTRFIQKTRITAKPLTTNAAFTAIAAGRSLYALTPNAVYRYKNNTFEQIYSSPDLPQVNTVTDLGTNIYIGTANGLFLKSSKKSKPDKIDDVKVNSLTTLKNSVFAATVNGVLKLYGDKIIKRYLEGENITCINIDSVGLMWISTSEALFKLTMNNNILQPAKPFPTSCDSLPSVQVKSISTDALGDTWILSDVCISKYVGREKRYISYYEPRRSALQSSLTNKMFEDSEGHVWVTYTKDGAGFDRINTKTHTVEHFPHLPYASTSYPYTSITHCIYEDADGNMLFGNDNGLAILAPKSKVFRVIDTKQGLPSKVVTAVYQDRLGNYWIGTDKGFVRYSKKHKKVDLYHTHFGFKEGIVSAILGYTFLTPITRATTFHSIT